MSHINDPATVERVKARIRGLAPGVAFVATALREEYTVQTVEFTLGAGANEVALAHAIYGVMVALDSSIVHSLNVAVYLTMAKANFVVYNGERSTCQH
jgi:hypothetical protein